MIYDDYKSCLNKTAKKLNFNKSFVYWRNALLEKCMRIFKWDGLPETIPQKEIELRLIFRGFGGVVKQNNKYFVTFGEMSGVTEYADEFTVYTFANPKFSGVRKINDSCVIIDNNSVRNPLYPLIERYAILLAHADLSLQAVLINSRATGIIASKDQQQADSVKEWYNALVDGRTMSIVDSDNMDSLINAQGLRNISTTYPSSTSINDYFSITQNLLKSFYNDIGVKMGVEKRERVITDEVNSDEQRLLFNLDDMLYCRKKACEDLKNVFGIDNISVDLSKEFKVAVAQQESEEKTNENNN